MLSEASLNLVALRKSFYGSALFLCRRQSVSKRPVFLPVDSKDYQWVETLKVSPTPSVCRCPRTLAARSSDWLFSLCYHKVYMRDLSCFKSLTVGTLCSRK